MALGSVERATRAELRRLGIHASDSGLAAAALSLSRHVDAPDSTSAAAAVARELRGVLTELRRQASEKPQRDPIDELQSRRAARLAG